MYKEVFVFPVMIAFIIIVVHSALTNGKRATINFFGIGLIWVFLRELLYQNLFKIYEFTEGGFEILNVPITIPMGWLFTSYISLIIAQELTGIHLPRPDKAQFPMDTDGKHIQQDVYEKKIFPLIAVSLLIQSTISFCIENTAITMEWWHMINFTGEIAHLGLCFEGWPLTILLTLLIYFWITYPQIRTKKNKLFLLNAFGMLIYGNMVFYVFPFATDNVILLGLSTYLFMALYLFMFTFYWDYFLFLMIIVSLGSWVFRIVEKDLFNTGIPLYTRQFILSIVGFIAMFALLIYYLKFDKREWPWKNKFYVLPFIALYFSLFFI